MTNVMGNLVKLFNDVTGTITVLSLIAISGILGVSFIFNVPASKVAAGGVDVIVQEFHQQWKQNAAARNVFVAGDRETRDERASSFVGGFQNLWDAITQPFYVFTGDKEINIEPPTWGD